MENDDDQKPKKRAIGMAPSGSTKSQEQMAEFDEGNANHIAEEISNSISEAKESAEAMSVEINKSITGLTEALKRASCSSTCLTVMLIIVAAFQAFIAYQSFKITPFK